MATIKNLLSLALLLGSSSLLTAEDTPLWKPAVGDSWTYHVVVEVREGTELPAGIEGQKVEKLDGKTRATYTQTQVYKGVQPIKGGKDKAHAFYVFNGKQLEEIEYMHITDTAIDAVGIKHEGKSPKPAIIMSKAVPLIRSAWKGGEAFPLIMDQMIGDQKVRFFRKFKVLGWESLETDAGKFKALHVQVTGKNGAMEINRSYWFTPGKGFIKEVKKYYLANEVIFTQTRVLEKMGKATTPSP